MNKPWEDEPLPSHREGTSVRTWIVTLMVLIIMLAGYASLRQAIYGEEAAEAGGAPQQEGGEVAARVAKRGSKKKERNRSGSRVRQGPHEEAYAPLEVPDDDLVLGDVYADAEASRRADRHAHAEALARREAEMRAAESVPVPRDLWQPEGRYQPTSRWRDKGAPEDESVVLTMGGAPGPGALPEAAVERALDHDALMRCYREAAERVPRMQGRVHIRFVVQPDGRPSRVEVIRSTLRSRRVEDCLVRTARRWRFEQAGRATKFTSHFDFH